MSEKMVSGDDFPKVDQPEWAPCRVCEQTCGVGTPPARRPCPACNALGWILVAGKAARPAQGGDRNE